MKKTFPVNINGKIFYIDEDAYSLLLNYLRQLRDTFPGEEGAEIVADIECRISELLDEQIRSGSAVIVIEDVKRVIEIMGRPEDISDESGFDGDEPAAEAQAAPMQTPVCPVPPPLHRKLYRDPRHAVFGGVIAGIAQYLGWDITVMRILIVVIALCTKLFPCAIIYLVAWMVIPVARTPRQILEMQGQPVTLDNVGQTVINSVNPPAAPVPDDSSNFVRFINNFFLIIAKCILVLFAFVGGLAAIACGVVALVIIAGMICLFFGNAPGLLDGLDLYSISAPYLEAWGVTFVLLAVALPCALLAWLGCTVIFKAPQISRTAFIVAVILELAFIIGASVCLNINPDSYASVAGIVVPTSIMVPLPLS